MTPIRVLADGLFGGAIAVWLGLAGWFAYRYFVPQWGHRRKPQQFILACTSTSAAAFLLLTQGWLPKSTLPVFQAFAVVSAGLAFLGVYLYEVEGGGRRR